MKKIVSLIISLCVVLSVCLIPSVMTTSAEETETNKVIQAEIKFTDGTQGTKKSAQIGLYSLGLKYAPERFELSKSYAQSAKTLTGVAPICGSDWSLKYDYAISDSIVGLGTIQLQESNTWQQAGDPAADHTAGLEKWKTETVSLSSWSCSDTWGRCLYAVALSCSTTAAVDTEKTYYAYYKNLRIVDGSGNTIYTLFDNSLTTDELRPQNWGNQSNLTMELSVADDPYPETETGENTGTETGGNTGTETGGNTEGGTNTTDTGVKDTIKATVTFTDGTEGTEKFAYTSLYGWQAAIFKDYKFSYGDKVMYEYALTDTNVPGLGTIDYQGTNGHTINSVPTGNESYDLYGNVYNCSSDMTKIDGYQANTWVTESVTPNISISALPGNSWRNSIGHVLLTVKTTAAVDTSKEYIVYYKNIRIVDASGKVQLVLFDGSQDVVGEKWSSQNAAMKLEKVSNPFPDSVVEAPITERVIKFSVNYTYTKAMQGKTGWLSLFGYLTSTATDLKKDDKITYQVMLETPMAGLGALSYQENEVRGGFWQCLHVFAVDKGMVDTNGLSITPDTDLSDVAANKWYTRTMDIANNDRQACHWIVGVNSTKAEAQADKEYNVYYKNIKVLHADGTETVLFDGSQSIKGEKFSELKGIECKLSVVDLIVSGPGGKNSPGTGDANRGRIVVLSYVMVLSLAVLSFTMLRKKSN